MLTSVLYFAKLSPKIQKNMNKMCIRDIHYPCLTAKRQGYGQKEKAEEGAAKRTPFLPPQMG